ncbi:MAG: hypothetical protein HYU70_16025 [Bacteroidetes bacterium]|nr:hypothetical protein [Bacteroidota bacterium]
METQATKQYLTSELIAEIHRQANDIVWKMGVYAKFTRNWYDVRTVSPTGLIHFEGNSDTGFKHIIERHGPFSFSHYFGGGALGNPNKFSRQSRSLDDFRNIGDDLFVNGQKDLKEHPDSHLFEKYRGTSNRFSGSDGTQREFQLLLYRGTKIVHSIYPTKNVDGKPLKRVLQTLARDNGNIKAFTRPFSDDYYIFRIPYVNDQEITRYEIIFKIDVNTKMSKAYIQLNSLAGDPVQTTYPHLFHFPVEIEFPVRPLMDDAPGLNQFIHTLSITDLSKLENVIAKFEKDLQAYFESQVKFTED